MHTRYAPRSALVRVPPWLLHHPLNPQVPGSNPLACTFSFFVFRLQASTRAPADAADAVTVDASTHAPAQASRPGSALHARASSGLTRDRGGADTNLQLPRSIRLRKWLGFTDKIEGHHTRQLRLHQRVTRWTHTSAQTTPGSTRWAHTPGEVSRAVDARASSGWTRGGVWRWLRWAVDTYERFP